MARMRLTDFPELVAQWHPLLNGDLAPAGTAAQSNKKAWWLCSAGHAYESVIANRVVLGRGCPYCARKRVGYGNDLATEYPQLASEWHPD